MSELSEKLCKNAERLTREMLGGGYLNDDDLDEESEEEW